MAYRKNPTDKQQSEIEAAANEGGISILVNAKTMVIGKSGERNNAGVVMPPSDRPGKFETPGKA